MMKNRLIPIVRGNGHTPQGGAMMIEILVTILVLAVGLLGLAGLQLSAMKFTKDAASRSNATLLTAELADRMRANMEGVKQASYKRDLAYAASIAAGLPADPGCGKTTDCTYTTMATLDLNQWLTAIAATLPEGTGALIEDPVNKSGWTIYVMWMEKSLNEANKDNAAVSTKDRNCTGPAGWAAPPDGVRCLYTAFMP